MNFRCALERLERSRNGDTTKKKKTRPSALTDGVAQGDGLLLAAPFYAEIDALPDDARGMLQVEVRVGPVADPASYLGTLPPCPGGYFLMRRTFVIYKDATSSLPNLHQGVQES